MKKFYPILYQTEMVQAILEARKTKTRRLKGLEEINKNPDYYVWLNDYPQIDIPRQAVRFDDKFYYVFTGKHNNSFLNVVTCPYGEVGDVLWVRETWNTSENVRPEIKEPFIYKADRSEIDGGIKWAARWKPSIYMPKAACRIFLEITDIKIERLQDISEEDAIKEGVKAKIIVDRKWFCNYLNKDSSFLDSKHVNHEYLGKIYSSPQISFITLWNSINGIESWQANPFVWVIEFEQIEKPENFI